MKIRSIVASAATDKVIMSSTIKATNDTATVAANSAVWVDATSNDTGGAGSLDITSLNLSGTLGTAKLNPSAPNGFEYYPGTAFDYLSVGQSATDTLQYTVSDGHGHTSVASVTITVQGVNAPPVAGSVTATTDAYDAIAVNALASDSDPNLADTLTITGLNLAGTKGTATIDPVTGKIDYNPNGAFDYLSAGETATDTLHYTVSDNHGATSTGTMTITVTGVNTPPIAVADNVTTSATQWINIAPLANDSDLNRDDKLTLQSVNTTGTKGTVQLNASTNTLTYFPGSALDYLSVGQTATDTFTYTVSDGHGGTSTATDTVTITGVNFAPTAGAVAATDSAYTTININALAADKVTGAKPGVVAGSGWLGAASTSDDVGQQRDGSIAEDAEPCPQIIPEADAEFAAGLRKPEEGVATIAANVAMGSTAYLALRHLAADVVFRAVGVERDLWVVEHHQ
jgi:VCBS repeat-containing protein